ncbi:hypothetical protein Q668_20020 [Alcanivorax sp. PN-3]|uniref:PHA/PHB synthase family protein n=1 Tax=Alloalcanivorax xenomutans TaxID=1094342 RepID=UPI0003B84BBB|nr:hypothetical protein Q668_20020 [Alcanivorax sp. PN-3]
MTRNVEADTSLFPGQVADIVQREVERVILRQIKGMEYLNQRGTDAGKTPKAELYRQGTLVLYHYLPQTEEVYRVPVLLVMSLINKPYIIDLAPGQSLVEYLVQKGFDVYLIDWGAPRDEDRSLRLEDYVMDFLPTCVARVQEDSGEPDVSILGYCFGGLLSVLYATQYPHGPLKNLLCLTTPIDFSGMTLQRAWTDRRHFDVDDIVDRLGNVPAEMILASFDMLRPASRFFSQIRLWDNMWNDEFVTAYRRLDRWSNDQIPFAGECFRQTVKELLQENRLVEGRFQLNGRKVDLGEITVPFMHVVAKYDHIVPYESARCLVHQVASEDRIEEVIEGGHVSLVAGRNAIKRLWPRIDGWLSERSL